jgi:hypothetical protein
MRLQQQLSLIRRNQINRPGRTLMDVNGEGQDTASERGEVHFLAALVDELMQAMLASGVMTKAQLNEVEQAVAQRVGSPPRAW